MTTLDCQTTNDHESPEKYIFNYENEEEDYDDDLSSKFSDLGIIITGNQAME